MTTNDQNAPVAGPSDESAAIAALRDLEQANDDLAAARTRDGYLAEIDAGNQQLLEALDTARREARRVLYASRSTAPATQAAQVVPYIWGYAVLNPKEPSHPARIVKTKDHADRVAAYLYEAEIIPLTDARMLAAKAAPQPAAQQGRTPVLSAAPSAPSCGPHINRLGRRRISGGWPGATFTESPHSGLSCFQGERTP